LFSGNPSRNAQPNAQGPAYGLWFHSVYDGSSASCRTDSGSFLPLFRLIPNGIGRKVYETTPRPALLLALAAAPGGETMTSRLRELIQQLGEAIHESVIESEQIAGVVQDIREHGFDVLLMLEATIGLNELSAKDSEDAEAGEEDGAEETPFSKNDLHFLHSLRISVEGEEENASDSDTD
jgi:hypothetical protein